MVALEMDSRQTPVYELPEDKTVLILDDDTAFRSRLGKAMTERGFIVSTVATVVDAKDIAELNPPAFAVVDMRLEDGNGLDVVAELRKHRPECKVVMLTGYGAIATAVAAMKAGAIDYLPKPADADEIVRALLGKNTEMPGPPDSPMSADRVRWEHIQRIYEMCDHNVSETARQLGMHRRTLQRILAKRAPK